MFLAMIPSPIYGLRLFAVCGIAWFAASGVVHAIYDQSSDKFEITTQLGHANYVLALATTNDGRQVISASADGTVKLWDIPTRKLVRTFRGLDLWNEGIVLTPDGRHVISGTGEVIVAPDGRRLISAADVIEMKIWNLETGLKVQNTRSNATNVSDANFKSGGCQFINAEKEDKRIKIWDLATGNYVCSLTGSWGHDAIAITSDGRQIVSAGGSNNTINLWDLASGKQVLSFKGHTDEINAVALVPNNRHLISGSKDKTVRLWNLKTGDLLRTFKGHSRQVGAIASSADGRHIVSASDDKTIMLWDLATGRLIQTLKGHLRDVDAVAFTSDDRMIVSGSKDKTVRLWDVATGELIHSFEGRSGSVNEIALSPNGRVLLSARSFDSSIKAWSLETGRLIRRFKAPRLNFVQSMAVTSDSRYLIAGDFNNNIKLWDFETGRLNYTFEGHVDWIRAVAITPDNHYLASGGEDTIIRVWEIATGKLIQVFRGHSDTVRSLAFIADGQKLVSGAYDNKIKIWDLETRQLVRTIDAHLRGVAAVAITSDGYNIVSGGGDLTAKVWDAATGRLLRTFKGHSDTVTSVAVTHNDNYLVTGSTDNTVKLWDFETGRLIKTIQEHSGNVNAVAVVPNSRLIVSGSEDGTIKISMDGAKSSSITLIADADDNWLSLTDQGFFDFSARSMTSSLSVVKGLEMYDLGQMYQSLYSPDLVREALAGDRDGEVKRAAEVVNLEKVIESGAVPEVRVWTSGSDSEIQSELITAGAEIRNNGGGIGRIEWRVNGQTVGVDHPAPRKGKAHTLSRSIPLDPGENTIEVVAYNGRNLLTSLPGTTKITFKPTGPVPKPTLHVLAIGINDYKDHVFGPLRLAAADANAFGQSMEAAGKGLYDHVTVTYVVSPGATLEKIEEAVDEIGRTVHPRDTFIFFAAAHGKSENGRFHLIPEDFSSDGAGSMAERAIDQDKLQEWIVNRIKAKRGLVLLDTCESGAVVASHLRSPTQAAASEAGIGRLHEAIGRPVLTAAAADQVALEGYEGHGVFTYAILDALARGDSNNNGTIEVSELAGHVQSLAPIFSQELRSGVPRPKRARNARPVLQIGQPIRSTQKQQKPRLGSSGEDFALVKRLPAALAR